MRWSGWERSGGLRLCAWGAGTRWPWRWSARRNSNSRWGQIAAGRGAGKVVGPESLALFGIDAVEFARSVWISHTYATPQNESRPALRQLLEVEWFPGPLVLSASLAAIPRNTCRLCRC